MQTALPPPLLLAGHPAIDFLNSVATPVSEVIDWLRDGAGLMDWAAATALFPEAPLSELRRHTSMSRLDKLAAEARDLRELLRGQLARPQPLRSSKPLASALNEVLARGSAFEKLASNGDELTVQRVERLQDPGQLLVPVASAIARLAIEEDPARIRACEGVGCTLWFLDQTKAGHRRFCSPTICGNRAKVAAFRSRQKGSTHA